MGLGYQNSTRHVVSDRRVKDRLDQHRQWMDYYQKYFNLSRDDASAKAMVHVKSGERFPTACNPPPWKGE